MNTVHDDIARSLAEGMDLDCTTLHLLTHGHRRSEYAVRGRDGLPLVIEIRRVVHRGGVVVRVMPARSLSELGPGVKVKFRRRDARTYHDVDVVYPGPVGGWMVVAS